ncbi:outer membrane beta-barrel protein [Oxalobacteraceae bacterium]|nr:outer membrane beta-barrel protein [Oxalobacteraceae bacterium]
MKNTLLACAISLLSLNAAHAEAAKPLHFLVGAGVSAGGDQLATVDYTNGSESKIRAGSGLALQFGAEYRVSPEFTVQSTVGYHIHFTQLANNGDASFSRIPVELVGYYHLNNNWRVGAGARWVSSAKVHGNGAASNLEQDYQNTTGAIVEAEYLFNSRFGVKVRAVKEEYKPEGSSHTYSGNHVGVIGNFYF